MPDMTVRKWYENVSAASTC